MHQISGCLSSTVTTMLEEINKSLIYEFFQIFIDGKSLDRFCDTKFSVIFRRNVKGDKI